MKITIHNPKISQVEKSAKRIRAFEKITSLDDLKDAIAKILDADICTELVNLAYSEDNMFAQEFFSDADTFFDTLDYDDDPKRLALMFFNGEDLDSRGPANPNRSYFRLDNAKNIESTDYPEDIYLENLDTEVIDYVVAHLDDREFPEAVQELVDEYLDNYVEE